MTEKDYQLQGFLANKLPIILFILSALFFIVTALGLFIDKSEGRELLTQSHSKDNVSHTTQGDAHAKDAHEKKF